MICSGVYEGRNFNVIVDNIQNGWEYLNNKSPGVYGISGLYANISTDASLYIGSSNEPRERNNNHFEQLEKDIHSNQHLQNAYKKYKLENFTVFLLEECDISNQFEREQNWLDFYNFNFPGHKCLFNIQEVVYPKIQVSEETREKMSRNRKGIWDEDKNPMFNSQRFGDKNPFFGKHHSPETLKILSDKAKERPGTWLGRHHSKETKEKLSKLRQGKKQSREAIDKMVKTSKERGLHEKSSQRMSIPVKQIDKDNLSIIKIWSSATEANRLLDIDKASIGRCCMKKSCRSGHPTKTAGGFKWEYSTREEYDNYIKENTLC